MLGLKHQGVELLPRGPVLKADEFAALTTAAEVVARAEAEAREIVAQARREAAEERERGHREGLEAGKAEAGAQLVATLAQSAAHVARLEAGVVEVVIRATRRVLGEFDARDRVERIVRQALELVRNETQVRLRVSPAQRDWLQSRVESLLAGFPRIQFLDIQADPRLPVDGCVLETELGVIDATVETQLRAIEQALLRSLR